MATRLISCKTLAERFWAKVQKSRERGGCWVWTANTTKDRQGNKRYGLINAGRRGEGMLYAHRVSWELHYGPILEDMYVLHHCDNPSCVRPSHLFLGDQTSNMKDMVAKGRQGRTGPKAGAGAKSSLTDEQLHALRVSAAVHTTSELARQFGVSITTVQNILTGRTNFLR
jgi:hypothetical protein